jgi:hypothetical protein
VGEDGKNTIESGYTLTDRVDEQGYVHVQSTTARASRPLRLGHFVPGPYWERKTASRLEDLPDELIHTVYVYIPNIVTHWYDEYSSYATEEGKLVANLWFEDETIDDCHQITIGEQPMKWIRDWLESQR